MSDSSELPLATQTQSPKQLWLTVKKTKVVGQVANPPEQIGDLPHPIAALKFNSLANLSLSV
jgi:hypothetical protein